MIKPIELDTIISALSIYDQILLRPIPESLRARALVGKAELMIGVRDEFDNAISLAEKARKLLGANMAEFFAAKTYLVEAELLLARRRKGARAEALWLTNRGVK